MAVSSFVMVCILVSNTVAAIIAINQATIHKATIEQKQLKDGTWVGDFASHLFCIFNCRCRSVTSNGRIHTFNKTKVYTIVLNGMCVTSRNVSFPSIIRYLASLPSAVASAVLMASFVQLIGIGFNNIKQVPMSERNVTILGVAVLFGSGVMFYRLEHSNPCRLLCNIYSVMVYL